MTTDRADGVAREEPNPRSYDAPAPEEEGGSASENRGTAWVLFVVLVAVALYYALHGATIDALTLHTR